MYSRKWWPVLVLLGSSMSIWQGCTDNPNPEGSPTPEITPTLAPTAPLTPSPTGTLEPDARDDDGDGYSEQEGDCDDTESGIAPNQSEVPYDGIDQDCDDEDLTDVDGDGYDALEAGGDDCDDGSEASYPGAPEIADSKDNDCDGFVDESLDTFDDDGDTFAESDGDCDDEDSSVYPEAEEVPYDGIDQDCTGLDLTDVDGDLVEGGSGPDCVDTDPQIYPGAPEVPYDGIDQDCLDGDLVDVDGDGAAGGKDGVDCDDQDPARAPELEEVPYNDIDEDCDGADLQDQDGDGQEAEEVGGADCNDLEASIYAGADEIAYDGIDQDCANGDLIDADGDGHAGLPGGGDDCDDADATSYPGATEVADGKDNDCDGKVDEDLDVTDDDGDGYSEATGDCNDASSSVHPGADEIPYDGIDQDCKAGDLVDVDGDGVTSSNVSGGTDCDDNAAQVYPGATEVAYDGIDQDCHAGDLVDVDGDGVASSLVTGGTDCDDEDGLTYPGATDVPYDGIDQDCASGDLVDVDGDGFSSTAVTGGTDCNDAASAIHPDATEVCDGKDNNCDNVVDTDATDRTTWYTDGDHDGYGDPETAAKACSGTSSQVSNALDCDDSSAARYPGATEVCDGADDDCDGQIDDGVQLTYYRDADLDGYGLSASSTAACTAPAGYVSDKTDCDDGHSTVNPGATEQCDTLDNDCDGQVDEGVQTTYYVDSDEDGFGNPAKTTLACAAPAGYVADATDCNDKVEDVNPAAPELCNNRDDNCNGKVDDGLTYLTWYKDVDQDGYGDPTVSIQSCSVAPAGYVLAGTDCNDASSAIHPAAAEVCNGVDENCNGQVDENVKTTFYSDGDGDGYGVSSQTTQACTKPVGYATVAGDCDDTRPTVNPSGTESCNGLDDDCDGQVDEGVKNTYYFDGDRDGYGISAITTQACSVPAGFSENSTDCNDADATIYPGATESLNLKDDDCDGTVDEGVAFSSCKAIKVSLPSSGSGIYMIDPDGLGTKYTPFQVYCDMTTDGGGWTRFFWVLADYGSVAADPFGNELSACPPSGTLCLGRIPSTENPTDFMIKDVNEKHYALWRFNSANATSNAALGAFRDHKTVCLGNSALWQPYAHNDTSGEGWCGNGGEGGCDSFHYQYNGACGARPAGTGTWSAELDGDTGCYAGAFKVGDKQPGYEPQCGAPDNNFLDDGPSDSDDKLGELYYR